MTKLRFASVRQLCVALSFLFVTLCISCSNTDYYTYSSVYGIVADYETGEPIPNVSVVLSPTNVSKHTSSDGTYKFEDLDAQQYTITFQKAGYQADRKLITAISGENLEVNVHLKQIKQSIKELNK